MSTALFSTNFGNFTPICQEVPLIVCRLVEYVEPICTAKSVSVAGMEIKNIGTFCSTIVFALISIILTLRGFRKELLIGKKEFGTMLILYGLCCVLEFLLYGGLLASLGDAEVYVDAAYVAMVSTTYFVLLFNAFVGYRWIEDGGLLSLSLLFSFSLTFFGGIYVIALNTKMQFTGPFTSLALFVVFFIFPLVAIVTYLVSQTILCAFVIYENRPLIFLYSSALAFAAGQVLLLIVNSKACTGLSGFVDGIFFSTILVFTSIALLEVFFESSSEDEFDFDDF